MPLEIVAVPPLSGVLTSVMVSVSPVSGNMESFTRTFRLLLVLSSRTVKESLLAVGGSFTFETVTVTVAESVREPSDIV